MISFTEAMLNVLTRILVVEWKDNSIPNQDNLCCPQKTPSNQIFVK